MRGIASCNIDLLSRQRVPMVRGRVEGKGEGGGKGKRRGKEEEEEGT